MLKTIFISFILILFFSSCINTIDLYNINNIKIHKVIFVEKKYAYIIYSILQETLYYNPGANVVINDIEANLLFPRINIKKTMEIELKPISKKSMFVVNENIDKINLNLYQQKALGAIEVIKFELNQIKKIYVSDLKNKKLIWPLQNKK